MGLNNWFLEECSEALSLEPQKGETMQEERLQKFKDAINDLLFAYYKDSQENRLIRSDLEPLPVLFRQATNENFISAYLAFLLNPAKSNIALKLIEKLYEHCGYKDELISLGRGNYEVRCEYSLPDDRSRIDIVVLRNDKIFIAIENKILSTEGFLQTNKYADFIKNKQEDSDYPTACIFLTPKGTSPKDPRFKPLSYKKLYDYIRECLSIADFSVDEYFFIRHFLNYIKERFMEGKKGFSEFSELSREFVKYKDFLNEVQQEYEKQAKSIFNDLLAKAFRSTFKPEDGWDIFSWGETRDFQLISKEKWNNGAIHLELYRIDPSRLMDGQPFWVRVDVEGDNRSGYRQLILDKLKEHEDVLMNLKARGYRLINDQKKLQLIEREEKLPKKGYEFTFDEFLEMAGRIYSELKEVFSIIDEIVADSQPQ